MNTVNDFKIGQRVQLHPATDLWMRGSRWGTVVAIGRKFVRIRLDVPSIVVRIRPENLLID